MGSDDRAEADLADLLFASVLNLADLLGIQHTAVAYGPCFRCALLGITGVEADRHDQKYPHLSWRAEAV